MPSPSKRIVLLDDPHAGWGGEGSVEFRLVYRGPLRATQRDPAAGTNQKAAHWQLKHEMRLQFHRQLLSVWENHPLLRIKRGEDLSALNTADLANSYRIPPWSFVPLVTSELQVVCGLEIVLLRRDHPGSSVWSGDMDNRVKTLIDALEVPDAHCGYSSDIPLDKACSPLYCLLEEDKLLSRVSVETDRLHDYPDGADLSYAEIQMKVSVTPLNVTMLNIGL